MSASYVRKTGRKWSRVAAGLLLLAGALKFPLVLGAAQEIPLSLEETIRQADAIVLGTVTARQSRWGDQSQRWMVTDYTLAVENVLYSSEQGEPIADTVVLTYWGGTIGGETQSISDLRLPAIGERLVMMLRPDWARRIEFSPVVGLNQGLFRVAADAGSVDRQTPVMLDAGGMLLGLTANGGIERGIAAAGATASVSLTTFANWLTSNIKAIKATPSQLRPLALQNDAQVMAGFGKMPLLQRTPSGPRSSLDDSRLPIDLPDAASLSAPHRDSSQSVFDSSPATLSPRRFDYVPLSAKPNLPIAVNNFPASLAPWSPEDQNQMAKWNYYADVFRVYATPTNTFAWRDNVFDLDGWVSSSTLQSVYGSPWGATTIGVTFTRSSGGTILEADIALNPAYSFTLDDESVYNGSTAQGFRLVLFHELGHMLGLDHNFNGMAVMNYFPSVFRFFAMPYMDDAAGIRALYPANAVSHTDLGVYLYYVSGTQSVTDATYPSSAVAGGSLTVNNVTIENVGTTTISTPTIEWYLTAARNFDSSYYSLGATTYSPALPAFTFYNPGSVQRTLTIPASVPAGSYYLAAYVRSDEGAGQASFPFSNNYAFSRVRIAVTVPAPPAPVLVSPANNGTGVSLNPTLIWSASSGATSYDIYFGTSASPPFYANTASTSRGVGPLGTATKYYWRVVAKNAGGSSSSGTLNFTTAAALPPPTLLSPANGATGVPRTPALHWSASSGATSYDVYFGTSNPPVVYANIASTSLSVGPLAGATKYYWNVVAKTGSAVSSPSATFSFTTTSKPPVVHQVWRNTSTGDVAAWLMNGLAVTQGASIYEGLDLGWRIDGIGDLDGDHQSDLIFRNTGTGDIAAWLMNGTAIGQGAILYAGLPLEWRLEAVADLDGDQKADLIFRNTSTGDIAAWLMNGAVAKQGGLIYAGLPLSWQLDRVGDLNGDGQADFVFRNTETGDVAGWLMNGFALTEGAIIGGAIPLEWRIAGIGDLNGDGKADLVFRNIESGDVAGFLMNGLTPAEGDIISSGLVLAWQIDAVADLNGDGKADLVFRNTESGDVAGWLMNGLTAVQGDIIFPGLPLAWQLEGVGDLDGN